MPCWLVAASTSIQLIWIFLHLLFVLGSGSIAVVYAILFVFDAGTGTGSVLFVLQEHAGSGRSSGREHTVLPSKCFSQSGQAFLVPFFLRMAVAFVE